MDDLYYNLPKINWDVKTGLDFYVITAIFLSSLTYCIVTCIQFCVVVIFFDHSDIKVMSLISVFGFLKGSIIVKPRESIASSVQEFSVSHKFWEQLHKSL